MNQQAINELFSWMKIILLTALMILALREFVFEPVSVHGGSMMPTFEEGDKVLLVKISPIENFDIIIFKARNEKNLIKRVIGIPGDSLKMEDDRLFLNGNPVEEPYLEKNRHWVKQHDYPYLTSEFGEFTVPAGYYFVLGDNRLNSVDSRTIGFIQEDAILGEVRYRISPFEHFGPVK